MPGYLSWADQPEYRGELSKRLDQLLVENARLPALLDRLEKLEAVADAARGLIDKDHNELPLERALAALESV